ncbi:MAG: hypothetical protein K0S22_2097 [Oscillospiraceae bacterium]|jgi:hypothetical protein|nr:hypothetical protein [Oscillospiraceae bacterium]
MSIEEMHGYTLNYGNHLKGYKDRLKFIDEAVRELCK